MKARTLYHKGKGGALYSWTIWTVGAAVHTEYGQVDGKKQHAIKAAVGKNLGRSNETSPENQAELEAESMYKNKLDRKYSTTPEKAEDPVFLPMLAHDFDKNKTKIVYPVDVQPKLDGFRCLAKWEGSGIVLRTRSGKVVEVEHIQKDLATWLPDNLVADGELYLHGAGFQTVSKLIKKYRPGQTEEIQLYIYDMFDAENTETAWEQRRNMLAETFQKGSPLSLIHVPTCTVKAEDKVYEAQRIFVEQGFEGAIVRRPSGLYELGYRSRDLLKVKTFTDDEFVIVGHESGRGKFADCVVWVCEAHGAGQFKVVPKGTLEEKRQLLAEAEKHHGKLLKVKFFEFSEDGIPRFPVGLGIRDRE